MLELTLITQLLIKRSTIKCILIKTKWSRSLKLQKCRYGFTFVFDVFCGIRPAQFLIFCFSEQFITLSPSPRQKIRTDSQKSAISENGDILQCATPPGSGSAVDTKCVFVICNCVRLGHKLGHTTWKSAAEMSNQGKNKQNSARTHAAA